MVNIEGAASYPPIPQEQLLAERAAALDIRHRVLDMPDCRIAQRSMPRGARWGCEEDLVPRALGSDIMAEIGSDHGFFDALFIFSQPGEDRLFAYELKRSHRLKCLTLKNHERGDGLEAYYELSGLGSLICVVEKTEAGKSKTEMRVSYLDGQISGALRFKRGDGETAVTLYDAELQMRRHFPTYEAFKEYTSTTLIWK